MIGRHPRIGMIVAFSLLALGGCTNIPAGVDDDPRGHTVILGGVAHGTGLSVPLVNCAPCHGKTLRGGSSGQPSCYACHGRTW